MARGALGDVWAEGGHNVDYGLRNRAHMSSLGVYGSRKQHEKEQTQSPDFVWNLIGFSAGVFDEIFLDPEEPELVFH